MRRPEIRPLAEIGFAKENGTGGAKLGGDGGILQRNRPRQCVRPGCRRHSVRGVDIVLEQHRNSVQGTAHTTSLSLAIECVRYRQRVRVDLDYMVQRGAL